MSSKTFEKKPTEYKFSIKPVYSKSKEKMQVKFDFSGDFKNETTLAEVRQTIVKCIQDYKFNKEFDEQVEALK